MSDFNWLKQGIPGVEVGEEEVGEVLPEPEPVAPLPKQETVLSARTSVTPPAPAAPVRRPQPADTTEDVVDAEWTPEPATPAPTPVAVTETPRLTVPLFPAEAAQPGAEVVQVLTQHIPKADTSGVPHFTNAVDIGPVRFRINQWNPR